MTNIRRLSSLAAAALIASSAKAGQVLVNFGNTPYTSDGSNTWQTFNLNNGSGQFAAVASTALLDTTGASSGLTITITGVVFKNGPTGPWNGLTNSVGATQAQFDAPTSGTKPGWFDSSSAQQREGFKFYDWDVTYTVSGFSASDTVQFDFAVGINGLGIGDRALTLSHPAGPTTLLNDVQTDAKAYYATVSGLTGSTSYSFLARSSGITSASLVNALAVTINPPPEIPDYDTWSQNYPGTDLTDPNGDHDADLLTNDAERLFGLDPTSGSSVNPISVPINRTTGTFSYTRRDDALTGRAYSVWYSLDLDHWFEDYSAVQIPGTPDANGVESVAVTITPALLAESKLFVRVQAGQPQTRALVFLIGGQSNAGGVASLYASENPLYNTAYGIPTTPDSTAEEVGIPLTAEGYPRSAIWKGASWVDLIPGSGYYTSPYPGDPNRHGIELPMAKLQEVAYPQHDKFFIKHGPGGHNLYSQWKANTGPDYITFMNYYNAAMADLTARYDVVEVVGLYWDQGESDEPQAAAYKQNLLDLIAALRTDTGIPDLPVFVRKHLFHHGNTAFAPIITAQVEVTNDDPHAHLLDLDLGTNEANFLEWAWIYGNGHLSSKAFLELSNRILAIPNP